MGERRISWESYHISEDYERSERNDILNDLNEEEDEDDELIAEELRNAPRLMESPFGVIEMNSNLNPFKKMEFWMLHANFNISGKELVIANFHEGVEGIKVISRYSLLVGFGRLFTDGEKGASEVKRALADSLINSDKYPDELYKKRRKMLIEH